MRHALFVFALLVPGLANAQTAEQGPLRWTFAEGDTHSYVFNWDFVQKEDVGEMNFRDVKIKIRYALEETITKVDGGVASVDAKVTALEASVDPMMMGMPMGKMGYDSAADNEGNMLRVLRHAVGKSFTFKISTSGQVTAVAGGQAIRDAVDEAIKVEMPAMLKKMGGGGGMGGGGMGGGGMGMGPEMVGMLANRLTVAFADETLESTLNLVNHVLPEDGTSESWTHDIKEKIPMLGSVTFKGKYTNQGVEDGKTRIRFKPDGKVELSKAESGGGSDAQEEEKKAISTMEVKRTKVRGTAFFGKGKLVSSEVTQTIEAEGELPEMLKAQARPGDSLLTTFKLTLRYSEKAEDPKQRF
jgi:hypothetical protein